MTKIRVLTAIADQGSESHNTQSGPILTVLSDFAGAEKLREVAESFLMFQSAQMHNAAILQDQLPAKIVNAYFLKGDEIDAKTFETWSASNEWHEHVKKSLTSPATFEAVVKKIRDELLALQKKRAP